MRTALLIVVVGGLLAACGGVTSLHPASSHLAPESDERLLGFWVGDAPEENSSAADRQPDLVLAVGPKEEGGPLHASALYLGADGRLTTETWVLLPTEIAGRAFLSFATTDLPMDQQTEWSLGRYDFPEGGRLRLQALDEHVVAEDVEAALVPGTVTRSEGAAREAIVQVKLTAETASLRAWLQERGDALWKREPLVLRRLGAR